MRGALIALLVLGLVVYPALADEDVNEYKVPELNEHIDMNDVPQKVGPFMHREYEENEIKEMRERWMRGEEEHGKQWTRWWMRDAYKEKALKAIEAAMERMKYMRMYGEAPGLEVAEQELNRIRARIMEANSPEEIEEIYEHAKEIVKEALEKAREHEEEMRERIREQVKASIEMQREFMEKIREMRREHEEEMKEWKEIADEWRRLREEYRRNPAVEANYFEMSKQMVITAINMALERLYTVQQIVPEANVENAITRLEALLARVQEANTLQELRAVYKEVKEEVREVQEEYIVGPLLMRQVDLLSGALERLRVAEEKIDRVVERLKAAGVDVNVIEDDVNELKAKIRGIRDAVTALQDQIDSNAITPREAAAQAKEIKEDIREVVEEIKELAKEIKEYVKEVRRND